MKCTNCGGALEGLMTVCPFCQIRQEVDLRQIPFRDLGLNPSMPCPDCGTVLNVIEFDLEKPVAIERCNTCHGTFFNPGELEFLLEARTHPIKWVDGPRLDHLANEALASHRVKYRKCPVCTEIMNHLNFGGRSGVIVDRCIRHGVWLEGGELQRVSEWWSAGGKHVHQAHETEKAREAFKSPPQSTLLPGGTLGPEVVKDGLDTLAGTWAVLEIVGGLLSGLSD